MAWFWGRVVELWAVGNNVGPFLVGGVIFVVRSGNLVIGLLEQTL
jgi:hypothetical protein